MDAVSITELKRLAGDNPQQFVIHAQADSAVKKTAKNGNPFVELRLVDAGGNLVLRVWEDSPVFSFAEGIRNGAFLTAEGFWFQNGSFGIEPKELRLGYLSEDETNSLLEGSGELRERQDADFAYIESAIDSMADPRLKALGLLFMERFGERFRRTAAARNYHHVRRGGLVEHVAQMMRCAEGVCGAYQNLNRDLVIAGVLFHDCGKLWENIYQKTGFRMLVSETAELLSHIPMGIELVNHLWNELTDSAESKDWLELDPPSNQVRLHLLHLIASHHGEIAFGSPVVPKTPEAMVLHHVDNIDAKLEMFAQGYEKSPELAEGVYERARPLPGRLVKPLPTFSDLDPPTQGDTEDMPGEENFLEDYGDSADQPDTGIKEEQFQPEEGSN